MAVGFRGETATSKLRLMCSEMKCQKYVKNRYFEANNQ